MSARTIAEAIIRLIARRKWAVIALVALAYVFAGLAYGNAVGWDFSKQPVDNGIEIWFLEDDPALLNYRGFHADFDNDEVILIAIRDEGGLFTKANLDLIADISSRVKAMPEIQNVTSLATVIHARIDADDPDEQIVAKRFYQAPLKDDAQALRVREQVLESFLRDDLLAKDMQTTLITARLEVLEDIDERRRGILDRMDAELRAAHLAAGKGERAWSWAGLSVANEALNEITQRDTVKYTILSTLVIAICLWFSLRRLTSVAIALAAVVVAVHMLLGVYLGLGYKLNLVTMILPSLVSVIGLTDSVYFITTYYQDRETLEAQGLTKREAIVRSFGFCFLPGLFNSITASVGFLAFATSRMAVIRQLGIFAGVGILLAFVSSVLICTIGCELFDVRPRRQEDAAGGAWTRAGLSWLSGFVLRHHGKIVAATIVTFAVACVGVAQIKVDSDPLNYFYPDHPVHRDAEAIEANFGPAAPLEFVVDTGRAEGAKEAAVLQAIRGLQNRTAEREAKVGNSVALTGVVERITELVTGEQAIPPQPGAVHQELEWFYDPRGTDDPLRLVTFPSYDKARLTFRVGKMTSKDVEELIGRIEADDADLKAAGATVKASGYVPLYVRLMDYLIQGQISSLATTFLVIFVIIAILFRSARYALLSVPPNVVPVAMTLGFMGFAGINLDGATVLIASISLGVAVDDTIHFIFKFRDVYERERDDAVAVKKTLETTGVAIATTSIVIALGFSVIALGDLRSLAYFGVLTAVTMISALLGELFVTPAIILTFGPRRPPADAPAPEPQA